ncbi:ATP-binding protein [Propionivibrio sp.]|uniref:ATP-binding protein n=1 Tax=Propionivibrio sp. TaxID=2212460 RepID=UPI003BF01C4C
MSTPSLAPLLRQLVDRLAQIDTPALSEEERSLLAELARHAANLPLPHLPLTASRLQQRRRERALQIHFDYALYGIIEADAEGVIHDANPAASSICNWHRKQLLGMRVRDIFAENSIQETAKHFALLAEQGISQAELTMLGEDGLHNITLSSIQADEDLFLHVIDDVTEARRLSQELLTARHAAEAANAAKGRFLANVSHEIRTPMNGIIGLTQLALMTSLDAQQRDYLNKIAQSGRTLLAMLNDLLDFAKIEAGKLEFEQRPVDLYAVLEELSVICAQSVPNQRIEVIFDISAELPRWIMSDQLRLTQILINLLGNAVKFTEHGQILLTIEVDFAADREILSISIADTGCGISAEAIARLFQPFTQADAGTTRRFGGTGLGLAIARQLAQGLGGELSVNSSLGIGSTFTLELPLIAATGSPGEATDSLAHRGAIRIENAGPRQSQAISHLIGALGGRTTGDSEANISLYVVTPDSPIKQRLEEAIARNTALLLLADPDTTFTLRTQCEGHPNIAVLSRPLTPLALCNACQQLGQPRAPASTVCDLEIPTEFRGAYVAVAEDILVNQQVICGLLERAGIEVLLANNGRELLDSLAAGDKQPELILMDVHMPELDGFAATRALRARGYRQPVIALSAGAGKEEQAQCLAAGMSDFLAKPIDLDELWGVLTCWLAPRNSDLPIHNEMRAVQADAAVPHWLAGCDINVSSALERFLGDSTALLRGVTVFCTQHAAAAERLQGFLDQRNQNSFVHVAHAVSGSAANIGAEALAALCRQAENLPAERWPSEAPALISQITQALNRITQAQAIHSS